MKKRTLALQIAGLLGAYLSGIAQMAGLTSVACIGMFAAALCISFSEANEP